MLITHSSFNMATGELKHEPEKDAWVTRECGTPLFLDDERETGICRACAAGWTHPHNYAVEDPT